MRAKRWLSRPAVVALVLAMVLAGVLPGVLPDAPVVSRVLGPEVAHAGSTGDLIQRVYTDKARFEPGATVPIKVDLHNRTGSAWMGTLDLTVRHLETTVHTDTSSTISLGNGASTTVTFDWTAGAADFRGYHAAVAVSGVDLSGTGIEISSAPTRFPRYGYISDFPAARGAQQSSDMILEMVRDYNLNLFQFYDWMWRHEKLIKRTGGQIDATWDDVFDRTLSWQTIRNDIDAVQDHGAYAMAYAMIYAAREGYEQMFGIDPNWGVYQDTGGQSQFNVDFNNGKYLWLFNPANTDWQDWILTEYEDAIDTAGFNGIHIDQMGQRNDVRDKDGWFVYLPSTFAQFLQAAKARLDANDPDNATITLNTVDGTVDGWAVNEVSIFGSSDFNYSEIWWLSDTYNELRNYIEQVRHNSGGKALVLAAYSNYEENIGPRYEAEDADLSGVATNDNHAGYTGTGFVDQFNSVGDSISWTIDFPEDGDYSLVFRYGSATGNTATRSVYVDSQLLGKVHFHSQPSWGAWVHDAWIQANLSAGNHTITLQYDSDDSTAINIDHLTLGTFEEHSIRLANAAIAASGATRIELGDTNHMLAHEYYPNKSKSMRDSLKAALRDHYQFITAYANLLFDPDVVPADHGNQWLQLTTNQDLSGNASADTIWQMVRRKADYDIIHLINLIGNDDEWRFSSNAPVSQTNIGVRYYPGPDASVSGVYLASPDIDHGITTQLSYTTGSDSRGNYLQFTVPSLDYWNLIYVRRSVTAPQDSIYEAEDAIKSGVGTNTNHSGYTGSGFVDQFSAADRGVSFLVDVPADDSYTLRFRYANATGAPATRGLYIDGQPAGTVTLPNLYAWNQWGTVDKVVRLSAGVHQVVLWYGSGNGGAINLDHLQVLRETNPATNSVRSVWMNNWQDIIAMHMASKLHPADQNQMYGPRLAELRYGQDWPTNQIVDATGFFRDETGSPVVSYTAVNPFDSEMWFEDDGTLTVRYLNYAGDALPFAINKRYAMVPEEAFLVVEYTFENLTGQTRTINFLEQVHLNNKTWNSGNVGWQHGWWDWSRNVLGTDMSQTGQYYLQFGAFQAMDSYQVGNDANTDPYHQESAPWHQFNATGSLNNNGGLWTQDLSLGFQKEITLQAYGSDTVAFWYAIAANQNDAEAASDTARAQTPAYWFAQTASAYEAWFSGGVQVNMADAGLNTAYRRSLIINKQSQQPEFGSWPAATNPAYEFKVWVRDSAVTAMGMDAAGFPAEARKYWNWMAAVQKQDGSYWTNYSAWHPNQGIYFVEPEHDDIGLFLIGVYHHYHNAKAVDQQDATDFLIAIWDDIKRAADFVHNNIEGTGFGMAEASIWEEEIEYNTFTQGLYAQGLYAASVLATEMNDTSRAADYLDGAQTIRAAVLRSFRASPRGLWNDSGRYFNRAVNTDGSPRLTVDGSSSLLWVFGLLDAGDERARDHRIRVLGRLTNDGWGVARYEGDQFYHSSAYSPGGQYEAQAAEPVWPQLSMYAAMQEHWTGNDDWALARLQWYVSRMGRGFVTPGEPVDWVTGEPLVSTMIEPVTGAWLQLALLVYLDEIDPRLPGY